MLTKRSVVSELNFEGCQICLGKNGVLETRTPDVNTAIELLCLIRSQISWSHAKFGVLDPTV